MKISELEARLKELREEHGDLPLMRWCSFYEKYVDVKSDIFYFDRECENCNTPIDAFYLDNA